VKPGRRRLFVIDGSKALRTAIDQVYGSDNPVQRCRNHKMTNITGYLPKQLQEQVLATMRAAYRLPAEEGKARLRKQADWLSVEYPSAAASLLEGLEETFTINRLGLPRQLQRCLAITNIIESSNSTVRLRTHRVSRWRNGEMATRWAGAAFLEAEKSFRKIVGFRHLWVLKAALDGQGDMSELDTKTRVG
jgi:transposase-like protein